MAEKRQKKQAAKAFEKETFSKDKEVTGDRKSTRLNSSHSTSSRMPSSA